MAECGSDASYSAGCHCELCRAAHAAYMRQWKAGRTAEQREADLLRGRQSSMRRRGKRLAQQAEWRANNRELKRERDRQWRGDNRELTRLFNAEYFAANRERLNQSRRDHYQANHERELAYRRDHYANNREMYYANVRKREALKRGASVSGADVTPDLLVARMAYWGNRCWMCGGPFEQVDHVKPLNKGGLHVLANLRPSCASCNRRKSDRWDGPASIMTMVRRAA